MDLRSVTLIFKRIKTIEKVQRQAARFIKRDYKSREEGCVTNMLNDLDLTSLQQL